jgi:hypothetical protein
MLIMNFYSRHIGFVSLSLLSLLFVGCAEEQRMNLSEATLKGKVTYNGKPVPYALVVVQGGSQSSTANADDEGNYSVPNAPVGEVRIGVNTAAGRGNMMSATMAAAQTKDKSIKPTFVDVPAKFFDPNTSGLTATVSNSKGENSFDIVIK